MGFEKAALPEANEGCGLPAMYAETCPACERKVILHCDSCKVQVSGCLCTLKERLQTATDLTAEEEEMALKLGWKKRGGLWTPGNN